MSVGLIVLTILLLMMFIAILIAAAGLKLKFKFFKKQKISDNDTKIIVDIVMKMFDVITGINAVDLESEHDENVLKINQYKQFLSTINDVNEFKKIYIEEQKTFDAKEKYNLKKYWRQILDLIYNNNTIEDYNDKYVWALEILDGKPELLKEIKDCVLEIKNKNIDMIELFKLIYDEVYTNLLNLSW